MRVHECWHAGCHRLCEPGQDYCQQHQADRIAKRKQAIKQKMNSQAYRIRNKERYKDYNRYKRDPQANAFYQSSQWSRVREYIKTRDMMIDGASGKSLADHDYIVDHIVPRRLCKDPFDASNLWLLSRKNHYRKTQIEEAIAAKPNGENMLRHISKPIWKKWLNEVPKK